MSTVTPQARNVRAIAEYEERAKTNRSFGERLGDGIAGVIGTPTFVALHLAWFLVWIVLNSGWIEGLQAYDPFPFNLLTLIVSLEAIFLTLVVVSTQNRMNRQAQKRAHLDLQINLLAEQESSHALVLLTEIAKHLGVEVPKDIDETPELAGKTDLHQLASQVDGEIPHG